LLASIGCIAVGVVLIAWWSGLALLAAFLFAGLAELTDRPERGRVVELPETAPYELGSAA
jgi:hypothetical protein